MWGSGSDKDDSWETPPHSCRQPSGFRLFVRLKAEPVNSKENTDGFLDFLPVNE